MKVRRSTEQWRRMGTSKEMLRVITQGVRVRFSGIPKTQQFCGSFLSTRSEKEEWQRLKEDYLRKGAISVVENADCEAHVSRSFFTPKKDEQGRKTGYRLIVDLRPLNAQVEPYPVRYLI